MIYAGIGSRSAPAVILASMATIAANLAGEGWLLRSGHADGADKAFEQGCDDAGGSKEIWLPWRGFNGSKSLLVFTDLSMPVKQRARRLLDHVLMNYKLGAADASLNTDGLQLHGLTHLLHLTLSEPHTNSNEDRVGTCVTDALRRSSHYEVPLFTSHPATPSI